MREKEGQQAAGGQRDAGYHRNVVGGGRGRHYAQVDRVYAGKFRYEGAIGHMLFLRA